MRRTLLYRLGEAPEAVRALHGPFASWYERAWGGPLEVHDGRAGGERAPDPRDWAGVVITGSSSSLTRMEPWMEDAAEFVRRAAELGTPVLGVCFGHQLIGAAFGGRVIRNPRGWEIGTFTVEVFQGEDPLFAGLPSTLTVNLVHEDMIAVPAAGGVRALAGNAKTPLQAVAYGDHVRGVQFHPEFSGAVVAGYLGVRRPLLEAEGQDVDGLIAGVSDAPQAVAVLRNFRTRFVDRA